MALHKPCQNTHCVPTGGMRNPFTSPDKRQEDESYRSTLDQSIKPRPRPREQLLTNVAEHELEKGRMAQEKGAPLTPLYQSSDARVSTAYVERSQLARTKGHDNPKDNHRDVEREKQHA